MIEVHELIRLGYERRQTISHCRGCVLDTEEGGSICSRILCSEEDCIIVDPKGIGLEPLIDYHKMKGTHA